MRMRRKELGLTQVELGKIAGVHIAYVGGIERLTQFCGRFFTAEDSLNKIAIALDLPFEELFSEDYLEMLRMKIAPRRSTYVWSREIDFRQITASDRSSFLLPSTEEVYEEKDTNDYLARNMAEMLYHEGDRVRVVIEFRFGLGGCGEHTLEETAIEYSKIFGVPIPTRERMRQAQEQGLNHLRHPGYIRKIRGGGEHYFPNELKENEQESRRSMREMIDALSNTITLEFTEPEPEPEPVTLPPPPPEIMPPTWFGEGKREYCALCHTAVMGHHTPEIDVCERCGDFVGYIPERHVGGYSARDAIFQEWNRVLNKDNAGEVFGYIQNKAECCDLYQGHYTVHFLEDDQKEVRDGTTIIGV